MKFNHAVYAAREDTANARQAQVIKLDAAGQPVNLDAHGQPFHYSAVYAAQDRQSYQVYQGAMTFLDAFFGDDNDTQTRKRFDFCKAQIKDVNHAETLKEKLVKAALGGSDAALVGYAAVCLYLNPYATVDFGWFTSGQTFATTDLEGYEAASADVAVTVSIAFPGRDTISDYEGFAVTYRPAGADVAVTPTTPQKPPTVAPAKPAPIAQPAPIQPMTLVHSHGSELVRVATGWQAESKSQPGTFHICSPDGSSCTCAGFNGRYRKCWHTATVRAYVAQQESDQQRLDRANALPVMPRRRGKSRMWK